MRTSLTWLVVAVGVCRVATAAPSMDVAQLLRNCRENLDEFASWRLKCEVRSQAHVDDQERPGTLTHFDLRSDSRRMCKRQWLWQDVNETKDTTLHPEEAAYLRLMWDGHTYRKYLKQDREDTGVLFYDDFATLEPSMKEYEIKSLQYRHEASFAMGHFPGSFRRIDEVLLQTRSVSLREDREVVNGIACYVVDANTTHGDITIWIDPEHGFAIAKRQIETTKAAGHVRYGRITGFDTFRETYYTTHFECVDGIWIGTEATRTREYVIRGTRYTDTAHAEITEFAPNPDHEALGSFEEDDVPNGTLVIIVPVTHIRYVWQDGELIKHVDDDIVERIDGMLETVMSTGDGGDSSLAPELTREEDLLPVDDDPNEPLPLVRRINPYLEPRAHCGLYCIYSLLRFKGLEPDFRDLVKPEYFGRLRGSSMAELNRAAHDYGFHAGVAARLSTKALRKSPHQGILHVKAGPEAKDYDHYALYLGTEKGKAKVFNPPEAPKLVSFADLASLWDGRVLFLSDRPFNIDALFRHDRQRLLFWTMVGVLIIVVARLGKRLWLALVGALPRRWVMGMTIGQGVALGLAALMGGVLYHFAHSEGLLANANATASLQKAYAGSFVPKISEQKTRELLDKDVVVIDARLASDFEKGHLERAINLPVDANDVVWEEIVAKIPAGSPILAYCQSAGCKFAEEVGVRLIEEGYSNVVIFKGGWAEWVEKHGKRETQAKEAKREDGDRNDRYTAPL